MTAAARNVPQMCFLLDGTAVEQLQGHVQKTRFKSGEPWSTGDLHLSSVLQKCPPVTQKCPENLTGLTADGDHGNLSRRGRQKPRVHIRPKVGPTLVVWSGSV